MSLAALFVSPGHGYHLELLTKPGLAPVFFPKGREFGLGEGACPAFVRASYGAVGTTHRLSKELLRWRTLLD
jgi:hypothetical protein